MPQPASLWGQEEEPDWNAEDQSSLQFTTLETVGQEEDLGDELSDLSDNSDLFHVDAISSDVPRTPEDADLALVMDLKQHMI